MLGEVFQKPLPAPSAWIRALAIAAVAVAACASPAQARSVDPVDRAIRGAARSGQITRAEKRQYLRAWRQSAREARRQGWHGKPHRAREIVAVRGVANSLVRRGLLDADRMPAVFANVRATTYVMARRPFPKHEARIRVPWDNVVYGYYSGRGVNVQPLFTFAWANVLYTAHSDTALRGIADRMEQLSVRRRGVQTWEYLFEFGGGDPPWVSGMAQSVAIQVFARTYERTGETHYRDVAQRALVGFNRSPRRGGFMVSQGEGRWYLLYSFNPGERILNGQLQALIGLYDYYQITGDEVGRTRLNQGIAAVIPMLHRFDTGAWSRYSLTTEADLGYHDFMTTQLNKLNNRTAIVQFADRGHRFASYRRTPPNVIVPTQLLRPLYPVRDGFRDQLRLSFFVDKRARTVVRFRNADGRLMQSLEVSGGRGNYAVVWDGRDRDGHAVRAGAYTVHFTTTDIIDNRRQGQLTQQVFVRRDTTAPQPQLVRIRPRGRTTRILVRVRDTESPYLFYAVLHNGRVVTKLRGGKRFAFTVDRRRTALRGARLVIADTSGNRTVIRL